MEFGVDGMLRHWALSKEIFGEDMSSPWWSNTGYYRLYLSLPRHAWTKDSKVVPFADCTGADWVGPDFLLYRLAALFGDGHVQWLGEPVSSWERFGCGWLSLLWYDASLAAKPPTDLPTLRHFADMEIVSARSDWSGDESLLALKCGPGLGHHATKQYRYDMGGAHVHPDAGHFVLFGHGQWLLRDDGYRFKVTGDHNTLLIDGHGQMGEGEQQLVDDNPRQPIGARGEWFVATEQIRTQSHPRIVEATSTPTFDYLVADATTAYRRASGLKRFLRRIVFLKPNLAIVVDDIEAEPGHELELRFHTASRARHDGADTYIAQGSKAVLRFQTLTPEGAELSDGDLPAGSMARPARAIGLDRLESPDRLYAIRLVARKATWQSIVALSWAAKGEEPAQVTLEKAGDAWIFTVAKQTIRLPVAGGGPTVTAD